MTPKQILQVIETEGLKEMSGTSPLACLNAMLHSNSRSCDGLFYKLPGRISLFTLKKAAAQWSRTLAGPEGEELDDAESSGSNEAASTVSGDNDVSLDETSSNASCSTESQSKSALAARESTRTASQVSKQKKKTGMMLPRVVLTPLKVNGAHMEASSGFAGKQVGDERSSSSSSSLSVLPGTLCGRTEMAREGPHLLRGVRKPSSGQTKRNRGDDIDFETPGSILVNTNLRALINSRTFNALPLHFQQQLLLLLPEVDRQAGADGLLRLSGSALNNEFFTHAAQSWRERLADGEFTHEMQVRIRQEMEREKKMELWKERFFEDYYGQKLGLTKEEQNSVPSDAENSTTAASPEGPARASGTPMAHQPDGRLRRRSLRCRTRRSWHKSHELEPSAPSEEAPSAEAAPTEEQEATPAADACRGSRAPPQAEAAPEATKAPSEADDAAAVAPDRIPSPPLGPQDQPKRKCFEQPASASFPEKKPRLEDRQSFRNTIESVHPEKPQPTKEEPKVPPIRIQLSRIKPPWVVNGQPAYQICPRIIPNPEPVSQDRSGTPAPADFKACPLQGRAQRAAAAPASTIGGGGGPGGGGRSPGESGGRVRQPRSHRSRHWRSKGTRGKRVPDLQRTQLLPPSHLGAETGLEELAVGVPSCGTEPAVEGAPRRGWAASLCPREAEGAAQLEEPAAGSLSDGGRATPALGCGTAGVPAGDSGPPWDDVSCEPSPGDAALEGHNMEERREPPAGGQFNGSWPEDSESSLLGGTSRKEGHEGRNPVVPGRCSAAKAVSASSADLALESTVRDSPEASGSPAQEHLPEDSGPAGMALPTARPQTARPWHGKGAPSTPEEASHSKAVLRAPCLNGTMRVYESRFPPPEAPLGAEVEAGKEQADEGAGPSVCPFSDEEAQSPLSETTETASDLEAELTDENPELNRDCSRAEGREVASGQRHLKERKEVKFESREDLPSDVEAASSQCGKTLPAPLLTAGKSIFPADVESQEGPRVGTPQPLSVEASDPLVVQGVAQSAPPWRVPPGSPCSAKAGAAASSLHKPLADACSFPVGAKSRERLVQEASCEEGPSMSDTTQKGACASQPLQDSAEGPCILEAASLPPEKNPELHPDSGSPDQAASQSQKVDQNKFPPSIGQDKTDSPCAGSAAGGSLEEKLKTAPGPRLPLIRTPLGPERPRSDPGEKPPGALGRKVFGSGFSGGAAAKAQSPQALEPFPIWGMLSHSKLVSPPSKCIAAGASLHPAREDWPPKPPRAPAGDREVENKKVLACSGSSQRKMEKRKEALPGPVGSVEPLQTLPLARDLPFFRLPKEPGKVAAQPLEPSSLPSQLNIKQAFYGKLSKLQLNSAHLNYASGAPFFSRSLEGNVPPFGHKANLATSRGGLAFSAQMFADNSSMEEISLKCSCSLKAMIMCKGCGAFCHDDCIGPSKLCVLCLVVR
ncbi:polycomb group protein ASXL1 isoform X2 [Candoia aspera]